MSTIYTYRVKCSTDNKYEYWALDETKPAPTTCPTNTAHTIDTDSITIIGVNSPNIVKVQEETIATGGNFRFANVDIQGPTGTQPYVNIFTWKKPISVLDIHLTPKDDNEGDRVDLSLLTSDVGLGYGGIGVLAADVNPGATAIFVSSTVYDNTSIGYDLTLLGATAWHMGEVLTKSGTTNQLIMEYPVGITCLAAVTIVKQEVFISDVVHNCIGPAHRYPIGEGKIGASHVPKGSQVVVRYNNVDNLVNKTMHAVINYLY